MDQWFAGRRSESVGRDHVDAAGDQAGQLQPDAPAVRSDRCLLDGNHCPVQLRRSISTRGLLAVADHSIRARYPSHRRMVHAREMESMVRVPLVPIGRQFIDINTRMN